MSLTFNKTNGTNGRYRADGETFSHIIVRTGRKWTLTVYTQKREHFASDNTTMVLTDMQVWVAIEESLTLAKEWAQAFDAAEVGEYEIGRRAIAAAADVADVAKVEAAR
jgi:hypothetical protein